MGTPFASSPHKMQCFCILHVMNTKSFEILRAPRGIGQESNQLAHPDLTPILGISRAPGGWWSNLRSRSQDMHLTSDKLCRGYARGTVWALLLQSESAKEHPIAAKGATTEPKASHIEHMSPTFHKLFLPGRRKAPKTSQSDLHNAQMTPNASFRHGK